MGFNSGFKGLITDYSVPEPENEWGPVLHVETRKAYLVCHRFLSRGVSKVSKLHLLLGIFVHFLGKFQCQEEVTVRGQVTVRVDPQHRMGRGLRNGTSISIPWKENPVYNEPFSYNGHTDIPAHARTQSVYFCCHIDLSSKLQLHFSCIVSWFSPARIVGKSGNIFTAPPSLLQ